MALQYETGTPSTVEDLIDKLQTFAAANNWTVDDYDSVNDECTIHEGTMYVHFGWDATGEELNICHSLGYTGGNAIDAMPDDSGNGSATIGSERHVNFTDGAGSAQAGPFTAYHFFLEDGAGGDPMYIHCIVEVVSGVYRHFGFGTIEKINDWTGGEYVYAHFWNQTANNIDNPTSVSHTCGLDAGTGTSLYDATLHLEDIGAQTTITDKWGIFRGSTPGTDTAGEDRVLLLGGARDGLWLRFLRHIQNSNLNAYVPITPIPVIYRDTSTTPDTWIWLGQQAGIGVVNMENFSSGDEITLGGETWIVFPWVRKQYLEDNTEESWNAGYAYRKS